MQRNIKVIYSIDKDKKHRNTRVEIENKVIEINHSFTITIILFYLTMTKLNNHF